MEPKNYSIIRSILKKEQGEKIAPYIFKINDTQKLGAYLRNERIIYEIYQERKVINVRKRKQNESVLLPNKKQKPLWCTPLKDIKLLRLMAKFSNPKIEMIFLVSQRII